MPKAIENCMECGKELYEGDIWYDVAIHKYRFGPGGRVETLEAEGIALLCSACLAKVDPKGISKRLGVTLKDWAEAEKAVSSELVAMVYGYARGRPKIDVKQCAKDLGISRDEVERAVVILEKKGKP